MGRRLERHAFGPRGGRLLLLLFRRRIYARREQVPQLLPRAPRVGEGDVGILADRVRLLFFVETVAEPPRLRARRGDLHIEAAAVGDFLDLSVRAQLSNLTIG